MRHAIRGILLPAMGRMAHHFVTVANDGFRKTQMLQHPIAADTWHVIFGTGQVGCWIARALRAMNIAVRAVNRNGFRPALMPDDVDIVAADVTDLEQAIYAAKGAAVVYQALNPPYHLWHQYFPMLQTHVLVAAREAGACYVSIENLYMYDLSMPITEDAPIRPRSRKGELRARMAEAVMAAHERGDVQATALRSADYYGPGVLNSAMGERVLGNLVLGKKAQIMGSLHVPHSWAYIEDVGKAAAILGTREEALGKVWITPHAPACTQREIVEMICSNLGIRPRTMVVSPMMIRLAGLLDPNARAFGEMMYMFTEPCVVTSRQFQETFGLHPTPVEQGIRAAIRWYVEYYRNV